MDLNFTEQDLQDAQFLVGLMNKATFSGMTSLQILQASRGLDFARRLVALVEANILEVKSVSKPVEDIPERKPGRKSK